MHDLWSRRFRTTSPFVSELPSSVLRMSRTPPKAADRRVKWVPHLGAFRHWMGRRGEAVAARRRKVRRGRRMHPTTTQQRTKEKFKRRSKAEIAGRATGNRSAMTVVSGQTMGVTTGICTSQWSRPGRHRAHGAPPTSRRRHARLELTSARRTPGESRRTRRGRGSLRRAFPQRNQRENTPRGRPGKSRCLTKARRRLPKVTIPKGR